jgi:tetratricopeptide (TPR) repeat protein
VYGAPEELIKEGNAVYNRGNYAAAAERYRLVLHDGYESAALYYNLGNSYFKMGKTGYAILNYERAKKLDPTDADISHNLRFANSFLQDKIEPVPQLFIFRWFESARGIFSASGWFIILALLLFACATIFIWFLVTESIALRRKLFISGMPVLFALIIAAGLFSGRIISDGAENKAVLVSPVINVKYAPERSAKDAFILHEGLKVSIDEKVDTWYRIRLDDGKTGWVTESELEII